MKLRHLTFLIILCGILTQCKKSEHEIDPNAECRVISYTHELNLYHDGKISTSKSNYHVVYDDLGRKSEIFLTGNSKPFIQYKYSENLVIEYHMSLDDIISTTYYKLNSNGLVDTEIVVADDTTEWRYEYNSEGFKTKISGGKDQTVSNFKYNKDGSVTATSSDGGTGHMTFYQEFLDKSNDFKGKFSKFLIKESISTDISNSYEKKLEYMYKLDDRGYSQEVSGNLTENGRLMTSLKTIFTERKCN